MSLQDGLNALQEKNYTDAIALLMSYCQQQKDRRSPYYIQAQIALARAYRGNNEPDKAIAICETLRDHTNREVRNWAAGLISILKSQENSGFFNLNSDSVIFQQHKAERSQSRGVKLLKPKVADSLSFATIVTFLVLLGSLIAFSWVILNGFAILQKLPLALGISVLILGVGLILAPWLMDLLLKILYKVQWENLTDIRQHSEEAAEIILQVSRQKSLQFPRLGRIDNPVPVAFCYGSLWGKGRIILSEGVFSYLDEEEIATVYAYQLAHLSQSNRVLMTLVTLPTLLLNGLAAQLMRYRRSPKLLSIAFNFLAILLDYMGKLSSLIGVYLSRTRAYHADHLASEITGNPNGLIRSLVKLAYGMVEEKGKLDKDQRIEKAIRPLNLYDPYNAVITGTAYRRFSAAQRMGEIFLWDLYNPWAWWLELISTHPLTGRRIKVLAHYAEQMGLNTEFSMATVVKEVDKLNRTQLTLSFALDWLAIALPLLGLLLGIILSRLNEGLSLFQGMCYGFGLGIWLQTFLVYPFASNNVTASNIFQLICDPYASPVRGRPVALAGKLTPDTAQNGTLIQNLRLQVASGMVMTHYAACIGQFSAIKSLNAFTNVPIKAVGWFYRGIMPSFDLIELDNAQDRLLSYHRLRALILGLLAIFLGLWI